MQPTRTLAWIYFFLGRMGDATARLEEAHHLNRTNLEPAHRLTLVDLSALGAAYRASGRLDDARRVLQEGLALAEANRETGGDPLAFSIAATLLCELGLTLNVQGHFVEAESFLRQALSRYDAAPPVIFTRLRPKARARIGLGQALAGQGKFAEAERHVLQGFDELKAHQDELAGDRRAILREAVEAVVQVYTASGRREQAEEWRNKLSAL